MVGIVALEWIPGTTSELLAMTVKPENDYLRCEMSIPGFTAEASLCNSKGSYAATFGSRGGAERSLVVSQLAQLAVKNDPVFCLAACLCCWKYDSGWCCHKCAVCLGDWVTTTVASRLP